MDVLGKFFWHAVQPEIISRRSTLHTRQGRPDFMLETRRARAHASNHRGMEPDVCLNSVPIPLYPDVDVGCLGQVRVK